MSNIPFNDEKSLIPRKNLITLLNKHSSIKTEPEVSIQLQRFGEKMLTDILTRAAMLTKLGNREIITADDVEFILEKEFDCVVGKRQAVSIENSAGESHLQKVADVKNSKNYN